MLTSDLPEDGCRVVFRFAARTSFKDHETSAHPLLSSCAPGNAASYGHTQKKIMVIDSIPVYYFVSI